MANPAMSDKYCLVTAEADPASLVAGIEIAGTCRAVMIRGNLVATGRKGAVIDESDAGTIGDNHPAD